MNDSRDIPGVIAPPPLIALATLLLGLALDWLLPSFILRGIFGFWTRMIVGAILIVIGGVMAIAAVGSFKKAETNVEPWKPALSLVTGGIFAWMRNPMYVSLFVLLTGIGIALASDWVIVLLVPAALILHFGVVKREERYLAILPICARSHAMGRQWSRAFSFQECDKWISLLSASFEPIESHQ
jgi:protein-S-isoprenylcysteine O-methyltransferase Ste14